LVIYKYDTSVKSIKTNITDYHHGGRVKNNLYFWAHLYKGSQDP